MRTDRVDVEVMLLSADAAAEGTDKEFQFILTHSGSNRNGDHFTDDELSKAAASAVGKKIDLLHSQSFHDIVGAIIDSKFVKETAAAYVLCRGELYTGESEPARLAYKLMKRQVVKHVSMECDYQEGECSVCGKRIKSKAEYCTHLKNYKGRDFHGKPVYEILHGVTFTGVGLLDREGADQGAKIRQVAVLDSPSGGQSMGDKTKEKSQAADDMMVDPTELSEADKVKLVKKLQGEVERLAKENEALQKKVDEAMAAQKSQARKARVEKLMAAYKEAGREMSDDETTAEAKRLQDMSDDAFDATETAVQAFAAGKKKKDPAGGGKTDPAVDEEDPTVDPKKKGKEKAKAEMSADAARKSGSPVHVGDDANKGTLAERLARGFNAIIRSGSADDE